MGKSVLLPPVLRHNEFRIHARRLRDALGQDNLKLEGPFSDQNGAVAEIADHVRRRVMNSYGTNEIEATVVALRPQDVIPENAPLSQKSMLEIPFVINAKPADGWQEYPESAGAVASAPAFAFRKGAARPVQVDELTMLAVSVFRVLGIESHFALLSLGDLRIDRELSEHNVVLEKTIPVVCSQMNGRIMLAHIMPYDFSNIAHHSLEVLDNDAMLSLIRMRNATRHAKDLMFDLASGNLRFEGEGELRAVQAGHMAFSGMMLWTQNDAYSTILHAQSVFGPNRMSGLFSLRDKMEIQLVHPFKSPKFHREIAAIHILGVGPQEISSEADGMPKNCDDCCVGQMSGTLTEHPQMALIERYARFAEIMTDHLHAECEKNDDKESSKN